MGTITHRVGDYDPSTRMPVSSFTRLMKHYPPLAFVVSGWWLASE